ESQPAPLLPRWRTLPSHPSSRTRQAWHRPESATANPAPLAAAFVAAPRRSGPSSLDHPPTPSQSPSAPHRPHAASAVLQPEPPFPSPSGSAPPHLRQAQSSHPQTLPPSALPVADPSAPSMRTHHSSRALPAR